MKDDVVDEMGHTNRGYGSKVPSGYFGKNHIMEGSHITVPREEGPMRNSMTMLSNLRIAPENTFV
jgi:hypothetical protein